MELIKLIRLIHFIFSTGKQIFKKENLFVSTDVLRNTLMFMKESGKSSRTYLCVIKIFSKQLLQADNPDCDIQLQCVTQTVDSFTSSI